MAQLTLLELAQEFCKRRSLPAPTTVAAAQDDTTLQIWGLMNEGIADICDRFEWQQLRVRVVITTVDINVAPNYAVISLIDDTDLPGYKAMLNRSFWDMNTRREIWGPFSPKDWDLMLALGVSQTMYNYTILGNNIQVYPQPSSSAVNWSLEYLTRYGVRAASGLVPQEFWLLDGDTTAFSNALILQDLKWRYNALKGLPYAEDQRQFEAMLVNLQGRDPAPDLVLDNGTEYSKLAAPGLYVAAGSWPIP